MTAFDTIAPEHRAILATLTGRQRQVLALLLHGHGQRAVAIRLGLSRSTVRGHIDSALTNLQDHPDTITALTAASETIRAQALTCKPHAGTPGESQDPPAPPIATGTP